MNNLVFNGKRRLLLLLCLLNIVLSTPVFSKSFSGNVFYNNADGVVKIIDKRTSTSASGNVYYLVFVSKPTVLQGGKNAGHAFVVWGVEDSQKKMSYGEAWGLYPINAMKTLALSTVPGEIKSDGVSSGEYNRLIVKVDKAVYDAATVRMKQWASKGTYQLFERDCLSFTIDIAAIANLKTPARAGYDNVPWNYLITLINAN